MTKWHIVVHAIGLTMLALILGLMLSSNLRSIRGWKRITVLQETIQKHVDRPCPPCPIEPCPCWHGSDN